MTENKLYIVATPIGNLEDITFRAINILKNVDFIAVEDTRTSYKLLKHYEINKKLISYHKFNEISSATKIIDLIVEGHNVALISDAGMPLIADPGNILINLARTKNIQVEVIPGASAFISSFVLSGFDLPMQFIGFLDAKSTKRQKQLQNLSTKTTVAYVSPHKLLDTIKDIDIVLADKAQIFLSKEITKIHEKHFWGTAKEVLEQLATSTIKGEYTICINLVPISKNKLKLNKYQQFSKIDQSNNES